MKTMKQIRDEMENATKGHDYEVNHLKADALLGDLILLLSQRFSEEERVNIREIVDLYDDVSKAYA